MTGEYKPRRSVFLPPGAVERRRYTCRDQNGKPRLLTDVNIMEALEKLCRLEEQEMGVMVQGLDGQARIISDTIKKRRAEEVARRDKG